MMLTDLADVLRAGGLRVVEVPGWKTRSADGNDFVGVKGILCHWTATNPAASGDYPTLNTILNGNGDTPGPLSQLGLGRDGTWYVIAAGVCWHAGNTDRVASDNYHAIGIEAEYHPAQGAWPEVQQRSYERGVAVLQRHYRVPLDEVRGHYEAAVPYGRKDDPKTLPGGMPGFRQRVGAVNLKEDDDLNGEEHEQLDQIFKAVAERGAPNNLPQAQRHANFIVDTLLPEIKKRPTVQMSAEDRAAIVAEVRTGLASEIADLLAERLKN